MVLVACGLLGGVRLICMAWRVPAKSRRRADLERSRNSLLRIDIRVYGAMLDRNSSMV